MKKEQFIEMIEQARKQARQDDCLEELLAEFEALERESGLSNDETRFRIPYVSANTLLESPWCQI